MIIIPALDILGGIPVRLYQGDYNRKEVVASSPAEVLLGFAWAGVSLIHVVDLDGARDGYPVNRDLILRASENLSVPVEVGGGIRTMEDIEGYLEHGISRVILGTSALQDRSLLADALRRWPENIAVGMDCRNGYVSTQGWLNDSEIWYLDFARELEDLGVKNIIFTDISRDGSMSGPNLSMLARLKDTVKIDITASGGIHTLEDLHKLKEMEIYGAIIGKALYSGDIRLSEAMQITGETI